jgi:hypothetical protein
VSGLVGAERGDDVAVSLTMRELGIPLPCFEAGRALSTSGRQR